MFLRVNDLTSFVPSKRILIYKTCTHTTRGVDDGIHVWKKCTFKSDGRHGCHRMYRRRNSYTSVTLETETRYVKPGVKWRAARQGVKRREFVWDVRNLCSTLRTFCIRGRQRKTILSNPSPSPPHSPDRPESGKTLSASQIVYDVYL